MAKSRKDRIASIELEMEQLENKRKQLISQEKEAERKGRVSRFCKRMGYLESVMPDLLELDDEHFKTFVNRHVNNDYGKRALANIIASMKKQASTNTAAPPSPKPAAPAPDTASQPDTAPAGADSIGANRGSATP